MQVVWVKGPSMSPYFNEGYEKTNTDSDMVLVSMWPWTSWPWQSRRRRLERGMVVTFRYDSLPLPSLPSFFPVREYYSALEWRLLIVA